MKYIITYYEDEFSAVAEAEVEVNDISELSKLANEYYEQNLKDKVEVAGAKWRRAE